LSFSSQLCQHIKFFKYIICISNIKIIIFQLGLQVTESKESLKNALGQAKQLQEHIATASQWTENVENAIEENADVKTLQVMIILLQRKSIFYV